MSAMPLSHYDVLPPDLDATRAERPVHIVEGS